MVSRDEGGPVLRFRYVLSRHTMELRPEGTGQMLVEVVLDKSTLGARILVPTPVSIFKVFYDFFLRAVNKKLSN